MWSLHLQICMKKGDMDEYLQWPFPEEMVFSAVHPDLGAALKIKCCPMTSSSRPTMSWREPFYSRDYFPLGKLERDGYVKDDQLILRLELPT